jgi:uncharacterized protein YqjF (DUF2071 family)
MGQTWRDLLFAHWDVPRALLEPFVPAPLALDERDGRCFVGVTPFRVCGLHLRTVPPLPPVARFCETNVRTYVTDGDRPGILFLTLDASSIAAVLGGRLLYRLPYHRSRLRSVAEGRFTEHAGERRGFRFRARFAPAGEAYEAPAGSLEAFLAERYCLYTASRGSLWRVDIHHSPWRLHAAAPGSSIGADVAALGAALTARPRLHVAPRQDVVLWAPTRVARLPSTWRG